MNEPAGTFRDGVHVLPVRVYYEDTDAGGIVYYTNYLKYAERARSEMLRAMGRSCSRIMAEEGIAFAVRHCTADYLKPAVLDDLLEVHSRLLEVGGASFRAEQTVKRDGVDLVRLELRVACMTTTGRPARLPGDLRASLEDFRNMNERN